MSKKEEIRDLLNRAAANTEGASVRVVENSDGTIDGEIIIPVGRGENAAEKLSEVQDTLRDERIGKTYYSTGLRFEITGNEKSPFDKSPEGLGQVFTRYNRSYVGTAATVGVIENQMKRKRYRKASQAVVRVHWNEYGMKPPRESK